jgi:hypothetical protein
MPDARQDGETIMIWFNQTKLEELKMQHTLAITEMLAAIDKANDLKMQIFRIEAERDKNG